MSKYQIKKLEEIDFQALIPLMKECFGMGVNVDYFRWKFIDNPAGLVVGFVAISEEDEIVAYYGAIPEVYIIDGKEERIYQACDAMTHSKHRRNGLFEELVIACNDYLNEKGELFLIGFGGEKSTPGLLKVGWRYLFDVKFYFFPKMFSAFTSKKTDQKIEEVVDFAKLRIAMASSNKDVLIRSTKDLQTFTWRVSNPMFEYKVIGYKGEEDNYSSYLCYYENGDKLYLFDFYFNSNKEGKILFSYLNKVLFQKVGCKGIIAFCQEEARFCKKVKKLGFVSNPFSIGPLSQKAPFIIYNGGKFDEEVISLSSNWSIGAFEHDAL